MTRTTCGQCGNPRVNLIWSDDIKCWTGLCTQCGAIINVDKTKVVFL